MINDFIVFLTSFYSIMIWLLFGVHISAVIFKILCWIFIFLNYRTCNDIINIIELNVMCLIYLILLDCMEKSFQKKSLIIYEFFYV